MTEYENEPIPGLPGIPPAGETILWQGSPDWRALARTAFHTRLIAGYFALLTMWAMIATFARGIRSPGDLTGVGMTALLGAICVALLHLLAWGAARTTIYTLTNRRIVLRIGMALPKCINLPLGLVGAVDLAARADGSGDMPLTIIGQQKLGYLALWPHARPWKLAAPQPMLRAVPNAAEVAALIARTCMAASPTGQVAMARPAVATFGEAVAA
ncbi:photosynthetic complex putative assembly protein PuhB [Sphingomonas hengshuiensis]|uniref:Photosynthetic complex assembly protein n=1 Tax=Sphingomonas hengshuiensis TaxID=1609977 RepID=A0A7U5BF06_9SPHN|nr:photosynthetic complex putative assembly protein PuhB [Sphingomonas hengshuiensis]AJP74046.1 photosynthetic complex assembly protein [Sphingomonas hengshuiensis]